MFFESLSQFLTPDRIIEIVGALIGLVYLFLEYKASVWLWPVGILMSLFYVVIYVTGKFYADAALQVYYVAANVYGLVVWLFVGRRQQNSENQIVETSKIVHTPTKLILPLTIISLLLWVIIYFILAKFTDSPIPAGDAFTTSLSIVAMWMLAKKYVEQWLLWIVVDIVCVFLYFTKGLPATAILYTVYVAVAVLGFFKWRKLCVTD